MIARVANRRRRATRSGRGSRVSPTKGAPRERLFEMVAYLLGCSVETAKRAWELRLL